MSRVQQHVPFASNGCRRHKQSHRPSSGDPVVSKATQRLIPGRVPMRWQLVQVNCFCFQGLGHLAFNGHQVRRPKIRLEVYKRLDRGQRQRVGSIDHSHTAAVPATAVQASALSTQGLGSVPPPAYSPQPHRPLCTTNSDAALSLYLREEGAEVEGRPTTLRSADPISCIHRKQCGQGCPQPPERRGPYRSGREAARRPVRGWEYGATQLPFPHLRASPRR